MVNKFKYQAVLRNGNGESTIVNTIEGRLGHVIELVKCAEGVEERIFGCFGTQTFEPEILMTKFTHQVLELVKQGLKITHSNTPIKLVSADLPNSKLNHCDTKVVNYDESKSYLSNQSYIFKSVSVGITALLLINERQVGDLGVYGLDSSPLPVPVEIVSILYRLSHIIKEQAILEVVFINDCEVQIADIKFGINSSLSNTFTDHYKKLEQIEKKLPTGIKLINYACTHKEKVMMVESAKASGHLINISPIMFNEDNQERLLMNLSKKATLMVAAIDELTAKATLCMKVEGVPIEIATVKLRSTMNLSTLDLVDITYTSLCSSGQLMNVDITSLSDALDIPSNDELTSLLGYSKSYKESYTNHSKVVQLKR
ncbi:MULTISPECIES: hypothetical protein [unclassified Pseudoalteromonas]|uniref:hypothetical protein n=1 Tax=unclassified Pseudoalteromonas TaxID=194690 RepID=UPI000407C781|nr:MULTISPECIES: hypothetical protein [unclassified Pseudoalteromonas]